jgi:CBS domain containing-hemolysin-like protein
MAIAIDEHGSLAGVLTIEDLVEVIVGEIQDEHGPTVDRITRLPDGVIEADGSIPLHELNEDYELALPESSDYVTLAGLVLSRLGSLPQPGEAVTVPPYVLTVLAIDERRVSRVRIARLDGEEGDPDRVNRADGEEGRDGGTVE